MAIRPPRAISRAIQSSADTRGSGPGGGGGAGGRAQRRPGRDARVEVRERQKFFRIQKVYKILYLLHTLDVFIA